MAKRTKAALEEEEKRAINKTNLKKLYSIFQCVVPYRKVFIIGFISLIFSSSTLLAFPFLCGEMLNLAAGKEHKYFSSITDVGLVLFGVLFVQGVFSFIRVYTFSIVSERSLADLRERIFEKIIWQPMQFFDNSRVGELISRITSDVTILQDMFSVTLAELVRQLVSLVLGTVIIAFLTPKLTGFMMLTFPALVIITLFFGKYIRKLSKKRQDNLAVSNVILEESLQSASIIKAFTSELFEIRRYKQSLQDTVRVGIHSSLFRGLFISFIIFILIGGMVSVGWYGAALLHAGEIDFGQLFAFFMYTIFIGASIAGLGDIFSQLQRAIGATERIQDILQLDDEQARATQNTNTALRFNGNISFNHVSFSYPSRTELAVLKDLTFSIKQGEKIALIGKSGSGKSTIINLLMQFYPPIQGTISVNGTPIQEFSLTDYRKNFGIVPQEVILFGGSIKENIAYGKLGASIEEVREAAKKANALDFIESFPEKFETLVGERGVKLSGGQRQRIAIARAILKNPAVLILDEATSSLDAQSEVLVQEALEKLMEGRTAIIIAHRLSTIKKVDRIFVISDGELAETGSHEELAGIDNGIYSNLLKLQLQ